MEIILQGLENVACIQADILITQKDEDRHIKTLNMVLKRLDDYGLKLQLNSASSGRSQSPTWAISSQPMASHQQMRR